MQQDQPELVGKDTPPHDKNELKIGLALSGGGVRATVFHFGLLGRLAAECLLEQVTFLSTVSGGSLGTGLVYTLSGNRWPSSEQFSKVVYPKARELLTQRSLQRDMIVRILTRPWHLLRGRAKLVSEGLQHCWGIEGLLKNVPVEPRWILNATSYESGKNWRFMPQRAGDYVLNYIPQPAIPIADAMAASAAVPGAIGYLAINTRDYSWVRYLGADGQEIESVEPAVETVHLWDGGIYDNLGVEALFKPHGGLRNGLNFLIVSDASAEFRFKSFPMLLLRTQRLIDLALDQARSLRARNVVSLLRQKPGSGVYLRIGGTAEYIMSQAGASPERVRAVQGWCLSIADVQAAAGLSTTLRQLSLDEFDRLYRHGWEVADCTLVSRCPGLFQHIESDQTLGA